MSSRDALLLSNIVFLALAALVFIAGMVAFLLNRANERAKDRELAAYHASAQVRINSAQADAAAALERAVAREAENLKSKERTATILRDVVALHAQTLAARTPALAAPPPAARLTGEIDDRTLSSDQRAKMASVLIRRHGDVTVMNGIGAEAERYAAEIRAVFTAAGWNVETGVAIEPEPPLAPLSLVLGTTAQDMAVRKAFEAAGVAVAYRPRSPMDRPTTIYVGS